MTGMMLISLIFFAWMFFSMKQQQERTRQQEQAKKDSLERVRKESGEKEKSAADIVEDGIALKPAEETAAITDSLAGIQKQAEGASSPGMGMQNAHPLREFTVETNRFTVTLSSKCACVTGIILKDLKGKNDTAYPSLLPPDKGGALSLELGREDLSLKIWAASDSSEGSIPVSSQPYTLTYSTVLLSGREISRAYTFYPDSHFVRHEFFPEDLNTEYTLHWKSGILETEEMPEGKGWGLTASFFSEVIINDGSSVLRDILKEKRIYNESSGVLRWVGLRRKYVAVLMNFYRNTTNKVIARPILEEGMDKNSRTHTYKLEVANRSFEKGALNFDFVILPLLHKKVLSYQQDYEKIIFSGWEKFFRADIWYVKLCGLVLHLLNTFYSVIPNYGIAIVLLTLLVRIVLLPLTLTQTKSMGKVQAHAPAIKEIKEKFKGNPQRANKEVMAYYKKEGVNPMAPMVGCFPMFLQLPVFIALFNVLGRAVELKEADFFVWMFDGHYHVFSDQDDHNRPQPEGHGIHDARHDAAFFRVLSLRPGPVLDHLQCLYHRPDHAVQEEAVRPCGRGQGEGGAHASRQEKGEAGQIVN
jgi:YidC/Oxa1 family membrane protein insertase